jgi:predicted RNase H-like HicB family nuclease
MEMDIYGFKAKVTVSEGTYSGEINELHVITQGKTLKQLKTRLEEATELTIDAIVKHPSEARNYPVSVSKKLGLKIYA